MRNNHLIAATGILLASLGVAGSATAQPYPDRRPLAPPHDDRGRRDQGYGHRPDAHPPRSANPWHCNDYKLRHHIRCHD